MTAQAGGRECQPIDDRLANWFTQSFGRRYRLLYGHRDDASAKREVDALVRTMGLDTSMRVLDICCGAGRHMDAMRAAGFDVWGFDLSPELLEAAQQRPAVRSRVVRGDIRMLPYGRQFDAAVNLFTSFGYFQRDEENYAALRSMTRALRPGGLLAMDHAHRAYVERTLKGRTVDQKGEATITACRRLEGDRVTKHTVIDYVDGTEPEQFVESVRLYRPDEMKAMFETAGMTDVRIVGSFDGRALDADSDRMITIGKRA